MVWLKGILMLLINIPMGEILREVSKINSAPKELNYTFETFLGRLVSCQT